MMSLPLLNIGFTSRLGVCRVEDSEWRGPGRGGKRNRHPSNREPADQQPWTTSAALLHSGSNVPQRLRTLPRRTTSHASTAK